MAGKGEEVLSMSIARLALLLEIGTVVANNPNIDYLWVGPQYLHIRYYNGSTALIPLPR